MKLTIYGFSGSPEDLKKMLEEGVNVNNISLNGTGKGLNIFLEPKPKKKVGKPPTLSPQQHEEMYKLYLQPGVTFEQIGKEYGCSRTYASRVVNRIAKERGVSF